MPKAFCNNCYVGKSSITCDYCKLSFCKVCTDRNLYSPCSGCGKIGTGCLNCIRVCTECGKNSYCADCVFNCTSCGESWIGYCCFYRHYCEEFLME